MGQPHPAASTAEQARQQALELADRRKQIDGEIAGHTDVLKREGVSMTSPLIDSQGFPLASLDIPSIREARSKVIALQNDRSAIDRQLNDLLHVALARQPTDQELAELCNGSTTSTPIAGFIATRNKDVGKPSFDQSSSTPSTSKQTAKRSALGTPQVEDMDKSATARSLLNSLGFLDRFLTIWIILAMILGVIIGEFAPNVQESFTDRGGQFQGVSAPLVVGLIVMMWPILTKVQYERFPEIFSTRRIWTHIAVSIVLNWIVGPFLMLGLAWATLPDLPTYRTGIIIVGIARCIAMVNIWTSLAKGDCDVCAILVIVNSALQMVLFSPYSLLLINVISDGDSLALDYQHVAIAVAMYLGVPLAAGIITRFLGFTIMGKDRFKKSFLPYFGPLSLLALLYVIIVIFALQARHVLDNLGPTFRCFVPLIIYFIIMWSGTFAACYWLSIRRAGKSAQTWDYSMSVVQSFTAGSNNFELAIAISISGYGANSDQALAATIGPLVEIPVLLALTYLSLYLGRKLRWGEKWDQERRRRLAEVHGADAEKGAASPSTSTREDQEQSKI